MWLISYRRQAIYRTANGVSRNEPMDTFAITWLHPVNFLTRSQFAHQALEDAPFDPAKGPQSCGIVLRIYSAVQIPSTTGKPAGVDVYGDDA